MLFINNLPILLGHPGKKPWEATPHPLGNWLPIPMEFQLSFCGGGMDIFWNYTIEILCTMRTCKSKFYTQPFRKLWQITVIVINRFKTPLNVFVLTYCKSSIKPLGAPLFQTHIVGGGGLINFFALKREGFLETGGLIEDLRYIPFSHSP